MPRFGAHMSVAGGLSLAWERLRSVRGEALQVFTRNQRQWKSAPLGEEEIDAFRAAAAASGNLPAASHAAYLVNLASPSEDVERRSLENFTEELRRCAALSIPWAVLHPGSHLGAGVEAGIARLAANLDRCLEAAGGVEVLLETTAGQGSGIGRSFEELRDILASMNHSERVGVCLDTAHVFAAGYDLKTPEGYADAMGSLDRTVGLGRVKFFHLNDSLGDLGSRLDRHTHIGEGKIGPAGFRNLVTDPRFADHPMVLETPKGEDLADDRRNLKVLRKLAGKKK
jgi:deoxyribonuclease-4